jgi:hypothetical protein
MTMRQVKALLVVIEKAELVEFYNSILSYRTAHAPKLPSLDEFLSLTSNNEANAPKIFDEKTDKLLEEHALKVLAERRQKHGQ